MLPQLYHGDCLELMRALPDGSVDVIVTDPPYPEVDRPYGRLTETEWHRLMRGVVAEAKRVLKPSGSAVFILQPNSERAGRMRPWLWEFMAWACREWNMVQDVWWWNHCAMPTGGATHAGLCRASLKACVWLGSPDCYRRQEAVLWQESDFLKSERLSHRAVSGRNARQNSPSGQGMNHYRSAMTAERRGGVTPFNVIPLPNANKSGGGNLGHPASTPQGLCEWWVRYICPPGGTILDPFLGSGTTGVAAVQGGFGFIGMEREAAYMDIAKARIEAAQAAVSGGL